MLLCQMSTRELSEPVRKSRMEGRSVMRSVGSDLSGATTGHTTILGPNCRERPSRSERAVPAAFMP